MRGTVHDTTPPPRKYSKNKLTASQIFGGVLLLLSMSVGVIGYLNQHAGLYLGKILGQILEDYYANISAELGSIAVTVLVIDMLNERRSEKQLREQLLLELGSQDNGIALRALRELKARDWLTAETLQGIDLYKANLQDADLGQLNLQGANMQKTKLQGAILAEANLQGPRLDGADLEGANLYWTNLRGIRLVSGVNFTNAGLSGVMLEDSLLPPSYFVGATMHLAQLQRAILACADLRGADLNEANLQDTDLGLANLEGAENLTVEQLAQVHSLGGAIMPDGKRYNGCFNLTDDIEGAIEFQNANPNNPKDMAQWYEVPVKEYLRGQAWAKKNLSRLQKLKSHR